jgi:hypothetical protein
MFDSQSKAFQDTGLPIVSVAQEVIGEKIIKGAVPMGLLESVGS